MIYLLAEKIKIQELYTYWLMIFEETIIYVNQNVLSIDGEIWKTHPFYSQYEGSNFGRIRRIQEKMLSCSRNGTP